MSFNTPLIVADLLLVFLMTLFLFVAWRSNLKFPGIREWFFGFTCASMNVLLFALQPRDQAWPMVLILEGLLLATGVFCFLGCRNYKNHPLTEFRPLAVLVLCTLSLSAYGFHVLQNAMIGFVATSVVTGGLCLIAGISLIQGRFTQHPIRHVFAAGIVFHGLFMAMRPSLFHQAAGLWFERYWSIAALDIILLEQILIAPLLAVSILLLINEENARLLRITAEYDSLTQLRNRGSFFVHLQKAASLSIRLQTPLSILLIDLDHFKEINDQYGHQTGDEVLKAFSKAAQSCLRNEDEIGRIGGEEFAVFLMNTPVAQAQLIAERLRLSIYEKPVYVNGKAILYSASIGIAAYDEDQGIDKALVMADQALYSAKHKGRNRVEVSNPTAINSLEMGRAGLEPATKGL
jgi:diguanylate cyclase (GGDEF)-like protein